MKVMNWPRQSGKTTAVIKWWSEDPMHRQIVVASQQRRDLLLDLLVKNYGHVFQRPFLDKALINASGLGPTTRFRSFGEGATLAIDELDDVLYALFGRPAEIVTLTGISAIPPGGEMHIAPSGEWVPGDVLLNTVRDGTIEAGE